MIKIRLHGLPEEVEAMMIEMKEKFEVISTSKVYEDRNSENIRIYMEVKI